MDEFNEILFVLLVVLEETKYSDPAHRSASSRESLRSTIGIAVVPTALEYEYRFTEYRFAEYEYDEIDARMPKRINPSRKDCKFPGALGSVDGKGNHIAEPGCVAGEHDHSIESKSAAAAIGDPEPHRFDQWVF